MSRNCNNFISIVAVTSLSAAVLLLCAASSRAELKVAIEHNDPAAATPAFTFKNIPSPSMNDAATKAEFVIVDGERAINSGPLDKLHDGQLPAEADLPGENFYFLVGTEGGRVMVDLRSAIRVKQVNTYSWHTGPRAPQVYSLYASDGRSAKFNPRPGHELRPEQCGWRLVAKVDTREEHGLAAGQYGVSISDSAGTIGKYRYLLFVISRTEQQDAFGNTFYSEIDVVDRDAPEPPRPIPAPTPPPNLSQSFASAGGKYQITIDPSHAPDLADWAFKQLAPVTQDWYPRIVKLLPSEGFQPPDKVTIDFGNDNAGYVAITRSNHITCTTPWFRQNLQGEARGCVVHEMVHVVQAYNYGDDPAQQPKASPPPNWLAEGIPDYIRWFLYEPQAHGADVQWMRGLQNFTPQYNGSYRVSANFLDWATRNYNTNLVPQLNVALRQSRYHDDLWTKLTAHKVDDLGEEWKKWVDAQRTTAATR